MIKVGIIFDRKNLENLTKKEVVKELTKEQGSILSAMKNETPVDTGEAKSSWRVSIDKDKVSLENDKDYIFYVNSGTSKIQPRYFIERVCLSFGRIENNAARLTQ